MNGIHDRLLDIYIEITDESIRTCDDPQCDEETCVLAKAIKNYFKCYYNENIDDFFKQNNLTNKG